MLKSNIVICIIMQFLMNYSSVFCTENVNNLYLKGNGHTEIDSDAINYDLPDEQIDDSDSKEIEELIDPHSLFYDRYSKKVIKNVEIVPNKQSDRSNQGHLKLSKNNEDCDIIKVYYKRLILMLLLNANLQTNDDLVEGKLNIRATVDQMEVLKKVEINNYSVKEIDVILSKILVTSSLYDSAFNMFNLVQVFRFLPNFIDHYVSHKVEAIIIACSLTAIVVLLRQLTYRRAFFIIIILFAIVSFYMTWWHLIMEAEAKMAAAQTKYIEMPAACQPDNVNTWNILKYFFPKTDDKECVKYYQARMVNAKMQVTPVVVLTHIFSTVILHPVPYIGEALSAFLNNSTEHLYWLAEPMQVIMVVCVVVVLLEIVFSTKNYSVQAHAPLPDSQKRQTIQLIREVLADIPANNPLSITESNKSVPLSIVNNDQQDRACEDQSCKLVSIKSQKELNYASGDSIKNDVLCGETEQTTVQHTEGTKINTENHIGDGDA